MIPAACQCCHATDEWVARARGKAGHGGRIDVKQIRFGSLGDQQQIAKRRVDQRRRLQPLGVFGIITPYNFPVMIPLWFWPYAVATGNSVVLKPSEQDPLTHQKIVELAEQAASLGDTAELEAKVAAILRAIWPDFPMPPKGSSMPPPAP